MLPSAKDGRHRGKSGAPGNGSLAMSAPRRPRRVTGRDEARAGEGRADPRGESARRPSKGRLPVPAADEIGARRRAPGSAQIPPGMESAHGAPSAAAKTLPESEGAGDLDRIPGGAPEETE